MVVVVAVGIVVFIAVVFLLRHMACVEDGQSSQPQAASQGFVVRKLTSIQGTAMKALPLTAIKIVVVVWQIVFQVRRTPSFERTVDVYEVCPAR